jgi:hypothetical protein
MADDNPELEGPAPTPSEMDQGTGMGPEPPEAETEPDGDENELCVPLEALAMAGEDDTMEKPEVGDKGQANIEYTVKKIEGDQAYLTLDALNGTKIAPPKGGPSDADKFAELQQMAGQMDQAGGPGQ